MGFRERMTARAEIIVDVLGETVTLDSGSYRADFTAYIDESWQPEIAGGIGIERIHPRAIFKTSDVGSYDLENGWRLECGDTTYRIIATAVDDVGNTTATLAKE